MICPKCKSDKGHVKDTMNSPDGKIYRRRLCMNCGTRFRTVESIDDGSEEFRRAYSNAAEIKSPLSRNSRRRDNHESE